MRWIAGSLLLCGYLQAQQVAFEGMAIDAATLQPLAGVHITLRATSAEEVDWLDSDTFGAISRPDGHFSIANLKPGNYLLAATRNGYLLLPPKNATRRDAFTIALKAGDQSKDLTLEMTPHAVIAGHVLDENGDPLQYIEVNAEPVGTSTSRELMGTTQARTDDLGQFRITLPPGKFYIHAMANGPQFREPVAGPPEIRSDGFVPPVYRDTYYPGFGSKDKATPVELSPGQALTGVDIRLAQKRSVTISGTVTGMPADAIPVVFPPLSRSPLPVETAVVLTPVKPSLPVPAEPSLFPG